MRGAEQQGGGQENSLDLLWLFVSIVVGVALIWYFGKNHIMAVVFPIRSYEIIAVQAVLTAWNHLLQMIPILPLPKANLQNLTEWSNYLQTKPTNVSFNTVSDLSTAVGNYLRYPIILILCGLAVCAYFSNLSSRFKITFNMRRLRGEEQANWPQITPVTTLDLVKDEIHQGPWAMAMSPVAFAKHHKIALFEKDANGRKVPSLFLGPAHRVFALQLGPLWTGIERTPIHVQALFAVFAARVNRDRDGADKLLMQIAKSANEQKLNFNGTQELLKKHADTKLVKRVLSQHAYLMTVMASMLELARSDGVVASADFLWLKPLDRRLWYMLNTVGRRTAVSEIAGAYAHWIAEKTAHKPLQIPMIEEAIKGLDTALKEIIYEDDE